MSKESSVLSVPGWFKGERAASGRVYEGRPNRAEYSERGAAAF